MKFDELGLPQDNGASDLQDSARLAGILTVFRWPRYIDLCKYIIKTSIGFAYTRHPLEIKYDFSRDQAICYLAGLGMRDQAFVAEKFITGRDLLSPSVKGHLERCKGRSASWLQDLWLRLDIIFHAKVKPLDEPNQLLCMLMVHPDKKFLKMWCNLNLQWRQSIKNYWCENDGAWRNEHELADWMIALIESHLN